MLNEISQLPKDKYCMMPLMKYLIHRNKVERWLPESGGWGRNWCLMGTVKIFQDGKVLQLLHKM